jgi:hypothetical protein
MSPTDDDYAINYGKDGGVAKFRKSQGLDVKTGAKKDVEEGSESAADIDKKIEFHKQGQAAAQYKGSMNKMHAAKIRELQAKKEALKQGVAEGDVVPFRKKEKPKAKPVHCPKCGNEMQGGKIDGERVKVCVPCLTYIKDKSVDEGVGKDIAKLAGITAVAGAAALGGQYLDDREPKVEFGNTQVTLVTNPGWGTIPNQTITVTANDGKQYKVWKSNRKGGGGHWFATPADVKEGVKDKVAAGLTAAALATSPVATDAAPSVAGVIASQSAARHAAAAREKSSDYATKQKPITWSEILKAMTNGIKSSR